MRRWALLFFLFLAGYGCSAPSVLPGQHQPVASATQPYSPKTLTNAVEDIGTTPTLPPDTIYEPDMAAIHSGYVQTIAQANGQALAQDAALQVGNAFQYNGNSYKVDEVSLLVLRDVPMVHVGQFDPHANPPAATRPARSVEIEALASTTRTQDPAVSMDAANLHAIAVLPANQSACAQCHAEGSLPPLALVYQFRELADD